MMPLEVEDLHDGQGIAGQKMCACVRAHVHRMLLLRKNIVG